MVLWNWIFKIIQYSIMPTYHSHTSISLTVNRTLNSMNHDVRYIISVWYAMIDCVKDGKFCHKYKKTNPSIYVIKCNKIELPSNEQYQQFCCPNYHALSKPAPGN